MHTGGAVDCIRAAILTPLPKTAFSLKITSPWWIPICRFRSASFLQVFWSSLAHKTASVMVLKLPEHRHQFPLSIYHHTFRWWVFESAYTFQVLQNAFSSFSAIKVVYLTISVNIIKASWRLDMIMRLIELRRVYWKVQVSSFKPNLILRNSCLFYYLFKFRNVCQRFWFFEHAQHYGKIGIMNFYGISN